jgi:hypothetical protein
VKGFANSDIKVGPQGAQGSQGVPGNNGSPGVAGVSGIQGPVRGIFFNLSSRLAPTHERVYIIHNLHFRKDEYLGVE